ncbi:MAG: four-helix bundle copper-binding protein [Pseudomonadota bacterium]|nr:four-helix bundle copper-binding protein [Pseudomonadota bacterium]
MQNTRLQECVRLCWECRHLCQETLFQHCLPTGGAHAGEYHVRIMVDCIQICQAAADFMTRNSPLHTSVCAACADVCEACARSCDDIGDEVMQRCAEACRACAQSCREMGRKREAA